MRGRNFRIHVQLHTILRIETEEGPVDHLEIDVPQGSTIQDLCIQLGVELPMHALLFARNGRAVGAEQALSDGDIIDLMPAISGGVDLSVRHQVSSKLRALT